MNVFASQEGLCSMELVSHFEQCSKLTYNVKIKLVRVTIIAAEKR